MKWARNIAVYNTELVETKIGTKTNSLPTIVNSSLVTYKANRFSLLSRVDCNPNKVSANRDYSVRE